MVDGMKRQKPWMKVSNSNSKLGTHKFAVIAVEVPFHINKQLTHWNISKFFIVSGQNVWSLYNISLNTPQTLDNSNH